MVLLELSSEEGYDFARPIGIWFPIENTSDFTTRYDFAWWTSYWTSGLLNLGREIICAGK